MNMISSAPTPGKAFKSYRRLFIVLPYEALVVLLEYIFLSTIGTSPVFIFLPEPFIEKLDDFVSINSALFSKM